MVDSVRLCVGVIVAKELWFVCVWVIRVIRFIRVVRVIRGVITVVRVLGY